MTVIRRNTCVNCYDEYAFQASGEGCGRAENSSQYCPRCALAVADALGRVPKTAKHDTITVTDAAEIQAVLFEHMRQEAEATNEKNSLFGLRCRELGDSLFAVKDGKTVASMHSKVVRMRGFRYQIQTWSDEREPMKVTKSGLRDLKTGQMRPERK